MVVWRFHWPFIKTIPIWSMQVYWKYLNWAKISVGSIVKIPSKLKISLAENTKMKTKTMRILKSGRCNFQYFFSAGCRRFRCPFKALQNPDVQLLIVGEKQWMGDRALYTRCDLGRKNKALIVMGPCWFWRNGYGCMCWLAKEILSIHEDSIYPGGNPFWGSK